jgi:putative transport protein
MFVELIELLRQQPVLTLFLIIGMGYLIGGINVGSFSLGPVAGVLFAGLFLGHFGFRMDPGAQSVGFAIFIFSVGYQAGPRFFEVLKTDGLKYFLLALVVASTGFGVAVIATNALELAPGTSAGLLSGGLTSSPTLAAAQDALRSGQVLPPEGITADAMIGNVATGYAITYIFGLAGLIAIIKLLPKILGIDLVAEAAKLEAQDSGEPPQMLNISARIYRLTDPSLTEMPFKELAQRYWDNRSVVRVRRAGEILDANEGQTLRMDDELLVLGPVDYFISTLGEVAQEVTPDTSTEVVSDTAQIVVIKPEIVDKTLGELDIPQQFGVLVTRLTRLRVELSLGLDTVLRRGDILTVIGPQEYINMLGDKVGHVEREMAETDMLTFAFGIAIGVLIGLFAVQVGQLSIGLGSAGGLLTAGLAIGYLRNIHPTFGRMPEAARWLLMEFGLLIFMAGVGLRAGGDIIETLLSAGPSLVLAGMVVTAVPIIVGYAFGRLVLNLNPVLLLGGITGSMTSGASLSVVTKAAQSPVPALGYTGAYAFANVLLTIAGSIILFF